MLDTPYCLQIASQIRRSSQSSESVTTDSYSCCSRIRVWRSFWTSASLLASGNDAHAHVGGSADGIGRRLPVLDQADLLLVVQPRALHEIQQLVTELISLPEPSDMRMDIDDAMHGLSDIFRGQTYPGKHRPIIDLDVFERCQDLLKGKNRRLRKANHYLAGGMFVCGHCGYGITGERIVRRIKNGKVHEYVYYRCGNLEPAPDHPVVRWREDHLEEAIQRDLRPTPHSRPWPPRLGSSLSDRRVQ